MAINRTFFFSLSTMVTKVAADAGHVIKDKVGGSVATSIISEFNREQEEFIKSKGKLMLTLESRCILVLVNVVFL